MAWLNEGGRAAFGLAVSFLVLATAAVILRFVARRLSKNRLGWDDWDIFAALIAMYAYVGLEIRTLIISDGTQDRPPQPTLEQLRLIQDFLKAYFVQWPFYFALVTLTRWSITAFYRRIFVTPGFCRGSYILDIASAIYFTIEFVVTFNICAPYYRLWDWSVSGTCLNYRLFLAFFESYGILIDIAILAMPLSMIQRLQLSARLKLAVSCIFFLGSFAFVTNIVRLIFVLAGSRDDVNFTYTTQFSNVQAGCSIVCACLPMYKPLFSTKKKRMVVNSTRFPGSSNANSLDYYSKTELSPWDFLDVDRKTGNMVRIETTPDSVLLDTVPPDRIGLYRTVQVEQSQF